MRIRSLVAGAVMATALLVGGNSAEAGFVGPVVVSGQTATSALSNSLGVGDVGVFIGSIMGEGVNFHHTFTFQTDENATAHATAVSVEIPELVGIENLMLSLNGGGWAPFIQDNVPAALANTLEIKGTTTGLYGGNYKADIALSQVPLPGAVLLLGSALAGLGIARRRAA